MLKIQISATQKLFTSVKWWVEDIWKNPCKKRFSGFNRYCKPLTHQFLIYEKRTDVVVQPGFE
jgi:hypothetical protein